MARKVNCIRALISCGLIFSSLFSIDAQTKRRTPAVKKTAAAVVPPVKVEATSADPPKKNERPANQGDGTTQDRTNQRTPSDVKEQTIVANKPTHFYEFSQPDFLISKILIEHDDTGKGKISFMKKGYEELISDPLQVSVAALARIDGAYTALDFLDSTDNYQYEKDFSHLGTSKFTLMNEGRERTATYNWTQNKEAKILNDEYRKIGNQFIWMFDISVARENQPLESPKLLDALDSLIRRNEISDLKQMVPFLQQLTNDERIPLIARNHAGKLVKQIEKEKKK
ncbi:MAG: hypothetical protein H7070_10275 [Saprospiraceae bacterium]|nr:hypothetical protein [Pyrinomonadaceae bacterium]